MPAMGTKSCEVIWGGQIMGAKIRAQDAREAAKKAAREADRAEAYGCGRSRSRATAGPHSRRQPLGNASTAAWLGSGSNAIAARRGRAATRCQSAGRSIRTRRGDSWLHVQVVGIHERILWPFRDNGIFSEAYAPGDGSKQCNRNTIGDCELWLVR
jgi:hypothetical protein